MNKSDKHNAGEVQLKIKEEASSWRGILYKHKKWLDTIPNTPLLRIIKDIHRSRTIIIDDDELK